MLARSIYAIKQAYRYRLALLKFLNTEHQCLHVTDLTEEKLNMLGVKVLALDFDGVLAPHGEPEILPKIQPWLETIGMPIYILSNKPFPARLNHLSRYPNLKCITDVSKKPYPDGLLKIAKEAAVSPESILLIDDRLLTGMLATCIAGCQGVWLKVAIKNFRHRPGIELGFQSLRIIEAVGLKLLSFLYKSR